MVLSYSVLPVSKSSSLSIIAAWSLCIDQEKVMKLKVIHGIPREPGNKIRNQRTKKYQKSKEF